MTDTRRRARAEPGTRSRGRPAASAMVPPGSQPGGYGQAPAGQLGVPPGTGYGQPGYDQPGYGQPGRYSA